MTVVRAVPIGDNGSISTFPPGILTRWVPNEPGGFSLAIGTVECQKENGRDQDKTHSSNTLNRIIHTDTYIGMNMSIKKW